MTERLNNKWVSKLHSSPHKHADLCPTHSIRMHVRGNGYYYCSECMHQLYERITQLKFKAAKLKRLWYIRMYPNEATLFEGLK